MKKFFYIALFFTTVAFGLLAIDSLGSNDSSKLFAVSFALIALAFQGYLHVSNSRS